MARQRPKLLQLEAETDMPQLTCLNSPAIAPLLLSLPALCFSALALHSLTSHLTCLGLHHNLCSTYRATTPLLFSIYILPDSHQRPCSDSVQSLAQPNFFLSLHRILLQVD
jgi:hypothetical protein